MVYHMDTEDKSSLIKELYYDSEYQELTVIFKNLKYLIYEKVRLRYFEMFTEIPSIGKYYLSIIKKQFKTKNMADKPKTINRASDQTRFIKMSIDVNKIKKEWIFVGEKSAYLNLTLAMKPDGEIDNYGNLGMITQDVPKVVFEKEKSLPKEQKTKGPILGNGAEFERKGFEGAPGEESGKLNDSGDINDDLPF